MRRFKLLQNEKNVHLALKEVRHAHLTQVVDVFEVDDNGEGKNCYVMEAVRGETLTDHLKKLGQLAMNEREQMTRCVIIQVLSAIQYLHGLGVAHRDIKMDNILVERKKLESDQIKVKLTDFGFTTLIK